MIFKKNRSPFLSLVHKAGVGALVCVFSCALIGCGSKESTSENEKKASASSSSSQPAVQSGEPDKGRSQQSDSKAVDIPPPGSLHEKAITRDMAMPPRADSSGKVDYGLLEPQPTFPGKPDLTPQELDALRRSAAMENVDLDAIEVVPPDKPGGRGMTLGEIKARAAELASGLTDLDVIEVVPPREPGGRGMTLGEIKALGTLAGPDTPPPDLPNTATPIGK